MSFSYAATCSSRGSNWAMTAKASRDARSGGDGIRDQLRLMQKLDHLVSRFPRRRMACPFEQVRDLFSRRHSGLLQSRIALQDKQGRALVQLGKQLQSAG